MAKESEFNRSMTIPTMDTKKKIRAMDMNDLLSSISFDTIRVNKNNMSIINKIDDVYTDSADAVKSLHLFLDEIEGELDYLEGINIDTTRSVIDFVNLHNMTKSSSGALQLASTGFNDYILSDKVISVMASSYPDGKIETVSKRELSNINKHKYWNKTIFRKDPVTVYLEEYPYAGAVVDIDIKLSGKLPVNYLYLTPVGKYSTGVELFFKINGSFVKIADDMIDDSMEWLLDRDTDPYYTDTIKLRLSKEAGDVGLISNNTDALSDILETLLVDEEPNINLIRSFIKDRKTQTFGTTYTIGLYSLRFGLKTYKPNGYAETGIIDKGRPLSKIQVSLDNKDSCRAQVYTIQSTEEGKFPDEVILDGECADIVRAISSTQGSDALPDDFLLKGGAIFPIVEIGDHYHQGYIMSVDDGATFTGMGMQDVRILRADTVGQLLPIAISGTPSYAISNGKLYVNFDIKSSGFTMTVRYRPTTLRVKILAESDGTSTPSIATYGIIIDDN